MTIYILNYNNYYNRILKKEATLEAYADYVTYTLSDVNFNPNDNVNTELVFGVGFYDGTGDYLLVADKNDNIVSRWFILEAIRTRQGQYRLILKRDVIAEYSTEILNAPCFIEKGIVQPSDPAIFNSENMTYNQIKTNEWLLKDQTQTPWLVAYVANSLVSDINIELPPDVSYDYSASSLDEFEAYTNYKEDAANCPEMFTDVNWHFHYTQNHGETVSFHRIKYKKNFDFIGQDEEDDRNSAFVTYSTIYDYECDTLTSSLKGWYVSSDYDSPYPSYTSLAGIDKYNEKVLKIDDGETVKYYRMRKTYKNKSETRACPDGYKTGTLYNVFQHWGEVETNKAVGSRSGIYAKVDYTEYYLTFIDITDSYERVNATVSGARRTLTDAPYGIITFPLLETTFGGVTYNSSEIGLSFAQKLYTTLDANCYDIQLLPYCPLSNLNNLIENGITLSGFSEGKDYDYIYVDEKVASIMFYPSVSSFTNVIPVIYTIPTDAVEFKVKNETEFVRLCSPNYNGVFEFKPTKNNGIEYFEVNATYKPYNPYIHLNPNFSGLYGGDFNDQRGLILGGDFSIATTRSAWESYQLQNKNYQNIFDREIQNMEFNNNQARIQERWNLASGTAQGAASGAMTGALKGGGYGMIAGAVVGGATALGGGIADMYYNEQVRNETLDYKKDMYGYSLGNIKALPQSLSKSSAFSINTKLYPFLEQYKATEMEEEALRNKIRYNGMTVMKIGKLSSYIYGVGPKYIKGKLIRLENLGDDFHLVSAIASEVDQGFFIHEGDN